MEGSLCADARGLWGTSQDEEAFLFPKFESQRAGWSGNSGFAGVFDGCIGTGNGLVAGDD